MGRTALSKRELRRGGVLARVKAGDLRVKDGAELMGVSYRRAKRLWKRYQAGGAAEPKHGNTWRASNRRRSEKERRKILWRVQDKYAGFGPLASEHLKSKDQLDVHPETPRRAGGWKKACGSGHAKASLSQAAGA